MLLCKLIQKKTYDVLTRKYTIVFLFIGVVVIIVSVLHFGETMMDWSRQRYAAVFYPFNDNIAGRSFLTTLCQHVPIDVVYTWVNGSDPRHLRGLSRAKEEYGFALTHTNSCWLGLCTESHMVLVRPDIPKMFTLSDLEEAEPVFGTVTETFAVSSPYSSQANATVLVFPDILSAKKAANKGFFSLDGKNYTVSIAFITDNWLSQNTVMLKNLFIMSNLSEDSTEEQVVQKFPVHIRHYIEKVYLRKSRGLAILKVADSEFMSYIPKQNDSSTNRNSLSISAANLVIELPSVHEDIAANRFMDNEELRYSMRSLEKHAPWVHHIYIVTSGQIPYWLNLDNPRVTIVTHEEIFPNKSHLPTFSSPAIECHLHRIPNLSKRFVYLNDDVMFGKNVWPEDFYTHTKGHKVYLSWPVPNCAEGCPSSWIRDGYCDKPCNNSQCQWDGGDCTSDNPLHSYQGILNHQDSGTVNSLQAAIAKNMCAGECINTWLADRYCDKACNTRSCGFDAGDCGTGDYGKIHQLILLDSQTEYQLPEGELVGFFNLTEFIISSNRTITEGFYNDHVVVRMMAISLKYSVLSIVLYPHYNTSRIKFTLKCEMGKEKQEHTFFLTISTVPKKHSSTASTEVSTESTIGSEEPILYEDFPVSARQPKFLVVVESTVSNDYAKVNSSASQLPSRFMNEIRELLQKFEKGELTEKGYWKEKSLIISNFVKFYQSVNNEMPPLVYNKELKMENDLQHRTLLLNLPLPTNTVPLPMDHAPDSLLELQKMKRTLVDLLIASNMTALSKNNTYLKNEKFKANEHQPAAVPTSSQIINALRYRTPSLRKRHLLDTFGDSLRHANKLYNEAFGYEARKVPSHIAHFVDKDVMDRLYNRFPDAFDTTSSHRIRSSNDMQFAFSYYYYLMSEMETVSVKEIFSRFDVDGSGTWSDREIRTLLAQLHDLPLDFSSVSEFEERIINCSLSHSYEESLTTPHYERYYDSKLPTVTKSLIMSCPHITDMLTQQFGQRKRNRFEILGEEEVSFKMIHNNLSHVLNQVDDIRKHPKKFVCLNDNMQHGTREAELIMSVIQDFYESLFPQRSQFELPPEYRNRFLYVDELNEWRKMRDMIRFATYLCLGVLIIFSMSSFCHSEVKPSTGRVRSTVRSRLRKSCQV